ncbi:unnamed protein product, partial [Prorocentrum cordatum]
RHRALFLGLLHPLSLFRAPSSLPLSLCSSLKIHSSPSPHQRPPCATPQEDVLELVFCGGSWEGAAMLQGEDFVGFVVYGCYRGTMALRHMAVTPGHRGRGHGLALVEHVRGRCLEQGVEEIGLFASPEALGFYRALGFHEVVGEDGDADDDLQIPMARLAAGPLAPGRRLGEAPGLPLHGAGA